MSALRNIWTDLVDKRLWPVAVALVAALVAVPVLLAKPAPSGRTVSPRAAASPPAVVGTAASATGSGGGPVGGRFRDPFKQLHVQKAATGTVTADAPGSTSTGSQQGSTGGGGNGGSQSSGGKGSSPKPEPTLGLKIKFGPSEGKRPERELTPGQPLPSAADPLIIFLQVGKDGRTASFLISSDAKPQGDGQCKPTTKACSTLLLEPGETEFFDVVAQKGTKQYQLDVLDVVHTS